MYIIKKYHPVWLIHISLHLFEITEEIEKGMWTVSEAGVPVGRKQ